MAVLSFECLEFFPLLIIPSLPFLLSRFQLPNATFNSCKRITSIHSSPFAFFAHWILVSPDILLGHRIGSCY